MADNEPKQNLQDQHATNTLNYGHLGTALYGDTAKPWFFMRSLAPATLQEEQNENHADRDSAQSQRPNAAFPFEILEQETKLSPESEVDRFESFVEHKHGQTPVRGSIAAQARLSSLVSLVGDDSQPPVLSDSALSSRGDLVAFGGASRLDDNISHDLRPKRTTAPIAAFVSGLGGSQIRLAQVERSSSIGKDVKTVPAVSERGSLWPGNGHPVRQVCFAATGGGQSTWLAVTTSSSTTILHPLLRDAPVFANQSHAPGSGAMEPSYLDPNPILTLPSSRTGGHAQADVSFHSKKHQYLAVVDEHGNWSTWQLQGRRSTGSRILFRIRLLTFNKLYTWAGLKRPPATSPYHDGWHKILWLASRDRDVDTLLVANRRNLVLYKSDGKMLASVQLDLGPMPEAQWILDIRKSSIEDGWIFALTSTRIFWISSTDGSVTPIAEGEQYTIVCSWRHFRGREDTSLSLCITETSEDIDILLWSQNTSVTSSFRITIRNEDNTLRFSWEEPAFLDLKDVIDRTSEAGQYSAPLSLRWLPVEAKGVKATHAAESSLHKLFALRRNMDVTEVLLRSSHPSFHPDNSSTPNTLLLPHVKYKNTKSTKNSKYVDPNDLNDFIEDELAGEHANIRPIPQAFDRHLHGTSTGNVLQTAASFNWTDVYAHLDPITSTVAPSQRLDLQDHLRILLATTSNTATTHPGRHLLSILSTPLPTVGDVESSSTQLSSLDLPDPSLRIVPCMTTHLTSMLSTYQSILPAWVTSLPPVIPDRIRVNKERLARSVAADITLATLAIGRPAAAAPPPALSDVPPTPSQTESQTPVPSSAPTHTLADLSINALLSSHAETSSLPTPTTFSQPREEHPSLACLRSYTTLQPNALLAPSPSLAAMLAHMPRDIKTDPATYNWRATEDALAASAQKADPRSKRRADKARKRRERLASSQVPGTAPVIGSSQLASSQVPGTASVLGSSQLAPTDVGGSQRPQSGEAVESSQITGLGGPPSSGFLQSSAGRSGTGPRKAGKKKGPAGFR